LALDAPPPLARISAPAAGRGEVPPSGQPPNPSASGKAYDVMVQSKTRGLPIFVNDKPSGKVTPARLTLADGDTVGVEVNGEMYHGRFDAKEGLFVRLPW
jgi:hypothetical protein